MMELVDFISKHFSSAYSLALSLAWFWLKLGLWVCLLSARLKLLLLRLSD